MTTSSEVVIRFATDADLEPITIFLRKFFFRDEPLNNSLKLLTDENPINEDLERFTFQVYGRGLDLVAEYDGRIVGVCLNGLIEKGTHMQEFCCTPGNKFERIVRMLEHAESKVDYFGRYPDIERIMSVLILSVETNVRGKGIAKKLVEKTRELAREHKAGLVAVECTSFYSAAVSNSLGFEKIFSLDYADYKVNGEVVLSPSPPHKAFAIFVSKI